MSRPLRRLTAPFAALALLAACGQADEPVPPPAPPAAPAATPAAGAPALEPTPPASPPTPGLLPGDEVGSCAEERGQAAAQALVDRCIQVSPATRPPCNTANPCAMIQGEIDRSCALWEDDDNVPEACAA
ncbi:MAG: hypothetical protein ACK4FB_10705 [Brevundimonas sp.]|uniref:hypothetical protein n=1 Tax=Brevundimonas sp. TaxID=1871086 RepID=UPI00391D6DE1